MAESDSADVCLHVLGSGGPMHAEGRGGAAYALWLGGRPSIVVDMAADTPSALGRLGVAPGSVDVILISHLHADHVAGLADFLWGEMTAERRQALVISGPGGNEPAFPSTPEFLKRLIGDAGAFPVMKSLYDGEPFAVRVITLTTPDRKPQHVLTHDDVVVTALSVPHGQAPVLAYRLDAPRFNIVFGGDQSGLNPDFAEFAAGTDLLVMHAVVNDHAQNDRLAAIAGPPGRLGALARDSRAKRVLIGHLMGDPGHTAQHSVWSLPDIEEVVRSFRREYKGPVTVASDFTRIDL